MKIFYIVVNNVKDPLFKVADEIVSLISQEGGRAFYRRENDITSEELEDVEGIITLGGDGTLIQASQELFEANKPFIGVNLGTLGYLTEIEKEHLESGILELMHGKSTIENRMMLLGKVEDYPKAVALNDIVVSRGGTPRIIQLHIYVNGELLHTYKGDGMIISTPTGSTAYSMSAGGPIVEPTASLFVLTPICSHGIDSRSIVLSSDDEIKIVLGKGRVTEVEHASISFDGGKTFDFETGHCIQITKAKKTTKLIKLNSASFLETLRTKMKGSES